jgi:tRNA1(Val) A37 N6-methylase TrmN6
MWGLAYKYGFNSGKILEPSVGVGNFIDYASTEYDQVTAYEISKYSARICKIVHPKTTVIEKSFAEHFYNGNVYNPKFEKDFDLVIGNPPYGKNVDKRAVAEAKRIGVSIAQFEHYFILRGLDCLKPGGLLVYVSTANLFTKGYEKIKEKISERAELVDGYLLPHKTFKTTEIGTSIIVLRKK